MYKNKSSQTSHKIPDNPAILFRIYKLTPYKIKLMEKISEEIKNKYDCYILSDNDNFNKTIKGCSNKIITAKNVLNKFPNLNTIRVQSCVYKSILTSKLISSFNTEHIYLWSELNKEYNFLWIIEDNVGFSGNINKVLDYYKNDYSDLISLEPEIVDNGFKYSNCATLKYLEYKRKCFEDEVAYEIPMQVQRWSNKLLNSLKKYLNKNYHRYGGAYAIEVALMDNLSTKTIDYKFIGNRFDDIKSVTYQMWLRIINDNSTINKFYHPLKF